MKKWVVTGYSNKMDGILIVVEAGDEVAAYQEAARIFTEGAGYHIRTEVENHVSTAVEDFIICPDNNETIEELTEYIKDSFPNTGPRRFWQAWITELKFGVQLQNAVCW